MKITHRPYFRSLEEELYLSDMIQRLKAKRVVKPPSTVQAESTKRTLERDPSEDDKHIARLWGPPPEGVYVNPDAIKDYRENPSNDALDRVTGARPLDANQVHVVESTRRRPKNTDGASFRSATSKEKKKAAIQAVIYTPPAKVSEKEVREKAINLIEYKSEPLKEVWVEVPWYKALWMKITGGQVKEVEDNQPKSWRDF